MNKRSRVARNFIKSYGRAAFRDMVKSFKAGESGQVIAGTLGVSRERVRQWRDTFGVTTTFYVVNPEVKALLGGEK